MLKNGFGFCGSNDIRYKWKEVPDTGCSCCNQTEVKDTALHQIHCPFLPRILIFNKSVYSLQQFIKRQYTEVFMGAILFCYMK